MSGASTALPDWADRWDDDACPKCGSQLVIVSVWPPYGATDTVCTQEACN